mmetsp:Transcript_90072/g.165274  ORF Transcript_90072/g.165274 Transcript_90072/m.165274 type:complete len:231 (+) Transcript_90072:1301-1993(+)
MPGREQHYVWTCPAGATHKHLPSLCQCVHSLAQLAVLKCLYPARSHSHGLQVCKAEFVITLRAARKGDRVDVMLHAVLAELVLRWAAPASRFLCREADLTIPTTIWHCTVGSDGDCRLIATLVWPNLMLLLEVLILLDAIHNNFNLGINGFRHRGLRLQLLYGGTRLMEIQPWLRVKVQAASVLNEAEAQEKAQAFGREASLSQCFKRDASILLFIWAGHNVVQQLLQGA